MDVGRSVGGVPTRMISPLLQGKSQVRCLDLHSLLFSFDEIFVWVVNTFYKVSIQWSKQFEISNVKMHFYVHFVE